MASLPVVSVLDRAESPLRPHLLTRFRHVSCHFVFIYGSTPWETLSLLFQIIRRSDLAECTLFLAINDNPWFYALDWK
jgi:hypothetical protein